MGLCKVCFTFPLTPVKGALRQEIKDAQFKEVRGGTQRAFLLYGALVIGTQSIQRGFGLAGERGLAISLLPMLGCVAVLVAVLRGIRQMDELGRKVHFEAIAFAFAATALVSMSWALMEGQGVRPMRASMICLLMCASWLVGLLIAERRYR